MCGLAGFIDYNNKLNEDTLYSMINSINHRGPDDKGIKIISSGKFTVGLAHARLSIIDLSSLGHQPMEYHNKIIVYNGEIYNFHEIRELLVKKGHNFLSNTDTEVILHAYKEWGIDCVTQFRGMFAFCIFDISKNKLILLRDRAGVKPIYFYHKAGLFLFASELKAFYKIKEFNKVINDTALLSYFEYGYVPAPQTIFNNCYQLNSGTFIEFDLNTADIIENRYWDITDYYKKSKFIGDYNEAKLELIQILDTSFNYRMLADVPVGVFLSGGYDSSGVCALLQSSRTEKIKTFTIGFEEGVNEAPFAKQIADYLGTNHTEYYCTSKEGQEIIPTLPYFYDEPFADSSAIPTMLVSKIAKQQVTVALSADGGDEIFCGYDIYNDLLNNLKKISYIPDFLKPLFSKFAKIIGNSSVLNNERYKSHILAFANSVNKDKWNEAADLFAIIQGLPLIYNNKIIKNSFDNFSSEYYKHNRGILNPIEHAMSKDYIMYLQNDILTKVDRATMSVSLEGREPLLDHKIIEFVAQLPFEYKYDGKTRKKIYKDIVHDYLPKELLNRPKCGFSLPIYSWLRNDMKYLIEEYLSEKALRESGLLNVEFNLKEVEKFKKGKQYYSVYIWRLLIFQMWYFKWMIQHDQ